jgi:hypothetical protein
MIGPYRKTVEFIPHADILLGDEELANARNAKNA